MDVVARSHSPVNCGSACRRSNAKATAPPGWPQRCQERETAQPLSDALAQGPARREFSSQISPQNTHWIGSKKDHLRGAAKLWQSRHRTISIRALELH